MPQVLDLTEVEQIIKDGNLEGFKNFIYRLNPNGEEIYWFRNITPLHLAAEHGKIEIAEYLLNSDIKWIKVDVNYPTKGSLSPLIFAVKANQFEMCELLVTKHNANLYSIYRPNLYDEPDCNTSSPPLISTPLHYAVLSKNIAVTKLLVFVGSNILAKNEEGETCLQLANKQGACDISAFLIEQLEVQEKERICYAQPEHINELGNAMQKPGSELLGDDLSKDEYQEILS